MSKILDAFRRLVSQPPAATLKTEIVQDSIRNRWSGYPSQGLDPTRLASLLRSADLGWTLSQYELFEEMEEKDAHLFSVLQTRKQAVLGLDYEIIPNDPARRIDRKMADFCGEAIYAIIDFEDGLLDLLDAIGKGISCLELIWDISGEQGRVAHIEWFHPKLLTFADSDIPRLLTAEQPVQGIELEPWKFLYHRYKGRSGFPTRGGLLRTLAWLYLFKNYTLKDWVIFAERFGMPLRQGVFSASASPDDRAALLAAVKALGSDGACIRSESTSIEITEAAKTGSIQVYASLVGFCDQQYSKAVLGQTLTTDAGQGGSGSYALGKVHGEVRQDLVRSDCEALSRVLRAQLLAPMVFYNFGLDAPVPFFKFHYEPPEDKTAKATYYTTLIRDCGLKVAEDHMYEEFEIPKPEEGQIIVTPPSAVPALFRQQLSARAGRDGQGQAGINELASASLDEGRGIFERLGRQVEGLLGGIISDDLDKLILTAFPHLSGRDLEDLVARAVFSGNLWGRAAVAREMARGASGASRGLSLTQRPTRGRKLHLRRLALAGGAISLEPLPFDQAIDWFRDKVILSAEEFTRLAARARSIAFGVSGLSRIDMLADLHNSLQEALESGESLDEWRRNITEKLAGRGWQGMSAQRLETIFRTNVQEAYNVGRYQQMTDPYVLKRRPYWMYDAVDDGRTREEHAAMDEKVFPADSPVWDQWYPPNGYNCFPAWTEVLTPSGWKEIGSICPQDRVIGGGGDEHLVTHVHRNRFDGRLVGLVFEDCRVDATPNHRVLTMNGWVRADVLKAGDVVVETRPLLPVNPSVGDEDVPDAKGGDCRVPGPVEREPAVTLAADSEVQGRHPDVDPLGAQASVDDVVVNRLEAQGLDVLQHELLGTRGGGKASRVPGRVASHVEHVGFRITGSNLRPAHRRRLTQMLSQAADRLRILLGLAQARVAALLSHAADHLLQVVGGPSPALVVADPLGPHGLAALPWRDPEMPEQAHQGAGVDAPPRAEPPIRKQLLNVTAPDDLGGRAILDRFDSPDDFRAWARLHGHLRKVVSIEPISYTGNVFNLTVEGDRSYIVRGATVHNCRCSVITLGDEELEEMGLAVEQEAPGFKPDPGWDYNPAKATRPGWAMLNRVQRTYPPPLQREFEALKEKAKKGGK